MTSKSDALARHGLEPRRRQASLSQAVVSGLTLLGDIVAIVLPAVLIYFLYVAPVDPGRPLLYVTAIIALVFVLLQSFQLAGLYRFNRIIAPGEQMPRIAWRFAIVFLLLLAAAFALKISENFSRVWVFGWVASSVLLTIGSRFLVAAVVRRWAIAGRLARNIVVYGGGRQGERLIRHIESLGEPWNHVVAVFDDRAGRVGTEVLGYPVAGGLRDLIDWARRHRADDILIALPWSAEQRILEILRILSSLPADIRLSPEFVGTDVLHRQASYHYGVPMLNVLDKPVAGWGALSKSAFDYVIAGLALVLLLPLLALIALAIRLDSRGPVLFRQPRYGFNNQLFDVYKFRTMHTDRADVAAEQLTQRDDPRVTRVGAVLRRLSLDELPQLLNVLRGEMSLVGPRPHAVRAKAGGRLYEEVVDEYAVRHKVKPGITGWAQINGWRGNTETEADILGRVEHDLFYIDNWSLALDLRILMQTLVVVIGGRNSY